MTTLMTYRPYRGLPSLHEDVDRWFNRFLGDALDAGSAGAFVPALDIEEDEDAYTLHVELPGVSPEDVEVSLDDDVLTVAGERRFYEDRSEERFRRRERHVGRFRRSVRLHDRVDGGKVSAIAKDGVLTITVPKAEDAKPRRIEVTSG